MYFKEEDSLFIQSNQDALFEKKEHLLSCLKLEDMVLLSNEEKIIKIESNDNETLKLLDSDGWSLGEESGDGWYSVSTSFQEESITLLLKGLHIEFV